MYDGWTIDDSAGQWVGALMAVPHPGALIVPSDTSGLNASVLSAVNGAILATPTLVPCELGAMLRSGIMAMPNTGGVGTSSVDIYGPDYAFIASAALFTPGYYSFSPIATYGSDAFIHVESHAGVAHTTAVKTISDAGVVGATTWTLPSSFRVNSIAVSLNRSILYYTVSDTMRRYDLNASSPLSNLFTITGNDSFTFDLFVLPDGTLLVGICNNITKSAEVRHYSAAGALLRTYPLGADANRGSVPFIALTQPAQDTFWARTFPTDDGGSNTYLHVRISDGTVLATFNGINVNAAGTVPLSCPLFVAPGRACVIRPPSVGCWSPESAGRTTRVTSVLERPRSRR